MPDRREQTDLTCTQKQLRNGITLGGGQLLSAALLLLINKDHLSDPDPLYSLPQTVKLIGEVITCADTSALVIYKGLI